MKSHQQSFIFWGFPWFLLAVVLYFSIGGLRLYFNHQNKPKQIAGKFQMEVSETEALLKNKVELISSVFSSNSQKEFHRKIEVFDDKDENEGIFLFIFKNDSLVYWNNNQVILTADFNKVHASTDFACRLKNGWYGFHGLQKGSYRFLGSYLIKSEFPFQNEFIRNQFSSRFNIPASVSIEKQRGTYPVYARDKTYLLSLNFENYKPDDNGLGGVIFLFFILGSLCLFYFLFIVFSNLALFRKTDNLMVLLYAATIVFLRMIQYYAGYPAEIYRSELFSPAWYSSSVFLPSLGDFTLDALMLFVVSLVIYQKCSIKIPKERNEQTIQLAWNTFILLMIIGFFQVVCYLIGDLVINSSLSLNLQNISGLSAESSFGLVIIAMLLFSLWLVSVRVLDFIFSDRKRWRVTALSASIAVGSYAFILWWVGLSVNFTVLSFFMVYVLWFWFVKTRQRTMFSIQNILFLVCFYTLFATILINRSNQIKETGKLNLLAGKLMTQRNPVTEVLYEQVERRLLSDSVVRNWITQKSPIGKFSQDSLANYLITEYFQDYWKKYQIQITRCDPSKELRIQPQGYLVNCNTYFRGIISNYGKATIIPNLYFLDYGFGKEYYLAILSGKSFEINQVAQPAIFIEFNLKNIYPDPGYPGLLMDKTRIDLPNISDYSYALFQNGRLIRAVGSNSYKMELGQYKTFSSVKPFFTEDGMIHFQYRINDSDALLISKKEDTVLSFATPFSYLFILFGVLTLLILGVANFPRNFKLFPTTLRNRLHFSLIGILVVTMLAIGMVQIINIIQISSKKNVDNLRERASSIVVEVQHKYSAQIDMREVEHAELEDFLIKLSNVFFTDINLFNDKGLLISSSRPQIFEEGLLSERMNASAYQKLIVDRNSVFIHHESIGSMQFNSAYLPFYSENDKLLGFVNLPYFAKQDELKKEISSFLVTFLNIYILLILFGVFITVLISNYITAPLAMLAGKMSQIRLGMVNEKIVWKQQDEIGQLVSQYNRMTEELGKSAEMLAKSERESAWREMARQVAHEIKNPLTPMKLSAQYLEKAWNEKAPDWDQRLARFTKTMVEQIDALSVIASDFSDFAKMQTVVFAKIDLMEVIRFVLSLYQDTTIIRYEFQTDISGCFIFGDRSQLLRLFTNLLNNAVQAIGDRQDGLIRIHITKEIKQLVVQVSDNGCGIPDERADRIFRPDFTTKTSGMGLGLAIVKGIVEGMNGEITYISGEQKGTTFCIKFPEIEKDTYE